MKLTLSKPLTIGEGEAAKTLDALDMDLDALTGADIAMCTRDAEGAKGEVVRVIVLDQDLHVQIASKASGISVNNLRRLGARDYVQVVTVVQSFLTGSD
jgi:hypothetical protein